MSLEPFLAQMPLEFRENLDVEDFVSTLIRWLQQAQSEINNTSELASNTDDFFDIGGTQTTSTSSETSTSGNDSPGTVAVDGVTTEILDRQIANVSNSGTALLDNNPPKNYRIEVRNADGSQVRINGNGRNINGQSSITINTQYTVRVIQYFIDTDDFGVI